MSLLAGVLHPRVTFTRASAGWYFDSTGILQSASTNIPRFDYNPATLAARGLLIEEVRTNSITNNSMTGAAVGSPGTLPTNWATSGSGTTASVIATGTENGITYIDIRFAGTTSSTSQMFIAFEGAVTASAAQVWTGSAYFRLVGGSFANISFTGVQVGVTGGTGTNKTTATITSAALCTQRLSIAVTAGASTTSVRPFFVCTPNGTSLAVDFTIRIGLPQLELGASATSPIVTSSIAVTRSADVASMPLVGRPAYTIAAAAEVDTPTTYAVQYAAELDDGSVNNRVGLYRVNVTGNASALFEAATVLIINNATLGVIAQGGVWKSAAAHANNISKMVVGGGPVTTNTAAGVIAPLTTLRLGCSNSSLNQLNGHLWSVRYWPRLLGDGELQSVTS
jgi:hypothetical protein